MKKKLENAGTTFGVIIVILLTFVAAWLITCGEFWLLCWALKALGITQILGWTVNFNWIGGTAFWIIYLILRSIFKSNVIVEK